MTEMRTPFTEGDVRSLKLGDVVYITGDIITGRDEMHMCTLEHAKKDAPVPNGVDGCVLYHCGPIMKEVGDGWAVVSAGPTTSARMNSLESEMIGTFDIRAIIGKGGMSREVIKTMAEIGCVYLAATGGAAVSLAESITEVTGVEWEDLGMAEAMWRFKVDRLGPLIVAIDASGNSLYENVRTSLVRDV